MPTRDAMRILPTALVGAVLVMAGCDSGTDSSTSQTTGAPKVDAGELSALARELTPKYEVEALTARSLPRGAPVVPPREKEEIPAVIKAVAGLRVDLPGRRDGFVYRYASQATAVAAAFLEGLSGGVFGCGA